MGKRYSAEETKLIVGLAQQGKSVQDIIETVKQKFGVERSELAIKGHIRAFSKPEAVEASV
jgi:hypothetical protein